MDKETKNAINRKYYRTEKGRKYRREHNLKSHYGMAIKEFERMEAAQAFGCAICGGDPSGRYGQFAVDHDHFSGAVRGLLCAKCNVGLGSFDDDPSKLRLAISYLQKHGRV